MRNIKKAAKLKTVIKLTTTMIIKLSTILIVTVSIVGCSTYSSHFGCPDARGLNCTPVSVVNEQIDSGRIESVTNQKKRCRGNRCSVLKQDDMKPELKLEDLR